MKNKKHGVSGHFGTLSAVDVPLSGWPLSLGGPWWLFRCPSSSRLAGVVGGGGEGVAEQQDIGHQKPRPGNQATGLPIWSLCLTRMWGAGAAVAGVRTRLRTARLEGVVRMYCVEWGHGK